MMIYGWMENLESFKDKTKKLHDIANCSTYYELFGVGESASEAAISRSFRILKRGKGKDPGFSDIVMDGYNILTTKRSEYDQFLRESNLAYFEENTRFIDASLILKIVSIIFCIIAIDFLVYSLRYLKYEERLQLWNAEKKKNRRNAMKLKDRRPEMYIMYLFSWVGPRIWRGVCSR